MPLTWYNIESGPAPWVDIFARSGSSSSSSIVSGGDPAPTATGFTVYGATSSGSAYSSSTQAQGPAVYELNYTEEQGASSSRSGSNIQDFSDAGTTSGITGSSNSGTTRDGAGGYTISSSLDSASPFNYTLSANGRSTLGAGGVTGSRSGSTYGNYVVAGNSISFIEHGHWTGLTVSTQSSSRISESPPFAESSSAAGTTSTATTFSTSSSSSTSFTLAAQTAVTSVGEVASTVSGIRVATTVSATSTYVVSTTGGWPDSTYPSTTTSSASYARDTTTAITVATTGYSSYTATYLSLTAHLVPCLRALPGEVLRMRNATASVVVDASALLGPSFADTTLTGAAYSGEQTSPSADSSVTRTLTAFVATTTTTVMTVAAATNISVVEQEFSGDLPIPASATVERWLNGQTTTTTTAILQGMDTTTSTQSGLGWSEVGYQLRSSISLATAPCVLLNTAGGTEAGVVQRTVQSLEWATVESWFGAAGESATTYRSPAVGLFAASGAGAAVLTRMERVGGFQSPAELGSAAAQGAGLTAGTGWHIGVGNQGSVGPNGLVAPVLMSGSTAASSDSSYTFVLSPAGVWSITSASTTSSDSYTASVSLLSAADRFGRFALHAVTRNSVSVAGGAHAYTAGAQTATLGGGWGWRYTLGDEFSTYSDKVLLSDSWTLIDLGSSVIAAETYSAGLATPVLATGLPAVHVRPFSTP